MTKNAEEQPPNDLMPDDVRRAIQARKELESEGKIEMVGRTSSGIAVWDLTDRSRLLRIKRAWRQMVCTILFLPALAFEHLVWKMALGIATLFDEPPASLITIADYLDRLSQWRERNEFSERSVWLSIKPE
jgi:hypothetical protein